MGVTIYQAPREKLVSSSPCPGCGGGRCAPHLTEVQRGLVTHLRSNSCCVADQTPTHICVPPKFGSHLDRLGGPPSLTAQCPPPPTPSGKPQTPSSSHLTGSSSPICLLLSHPCKSRPHHLWSQLLRQPPTRPCLPPLLFLLPEPKGFVLNPSPFLPLNCPRMKTRLP